MFFSVLFFSPFSLPSGESEPPGTSPPGGDLNLLIITVDTLRADHVGIYGNQSIKTPHMDALGRKGVLFSRAFCHTPLTLPSHCTLFTGTLPIFHGVRDNGHRLPDANVTLAQVMKDNGFRTAAFVGAFPLDSRFGLEQGFDVYDDHYGSRNAVRDLSFIERKAGEVNERAIEWIGRNSDGQFFVWVHYFDPHAPYDPPPPLTQEYTGREYDGEIAYTDAVIGELVAELDRLGLTDRTLIVLTSDHGEGLGEHEEMTHGIFIYDATMRVPLVFHNPKVVPENRVVTDQVGLVDVMPTVLDLMGIETGLELQGISLRSTILGREKASREFVYIESLAALIDRNWAALQGIRTEEWKFIDAPLPELYNLVEDPGELENVIGREPGLAEQLRIRLRTCIKDQSSSLSSRSFQAGVDEETARRLRSLGYFSGRRIEGDVERPDPKTMIRMDNIFNAAISASETGDLERARRLYQNVLETQPNFTMGYEYAAYNLYKMGRLDEAMGLLEKAASLDLKSSSLKARLGLYYQEAGRIDDSIAVLKDVVETHDDYAEAFNYLGVSYFKKGRLPEAVIAFQRALELDRDYAMAFNNLGNCYVAQNRFDLAIPEYEKALSVDENLASAHNGLAVAFYRKGLIDRALQSWVKSLEIDPRQPDTLYNLGRVHLRLGDKPKSLEFLELFLKTASPQEYAEDITEVERVVERLKKELKRTG